MSCYVEDCGRTDMAAHPRGGPSYKCKGHEDKYLTCDECGHRYVDNLLQTNRKNGNPVCEECA